MTKMHNHVGGLGCEAGSLGSARRAQVLSAVPTSGRGVKVRLGGVIYPRDQTPTIDGEKK